MTTRNTFKEHVLRVIAVVGLIAVLLLGAWGIIQLAFFIPTFIGNLTTTKTTAKEALVVSLPLSTVSGNAFTLSWSHTGGSGSYAYNVSYSCADGVSLKAPLATGALQSVPCNTPFNYTNAKDKLTLTPASTATKITTVSFTVTATNLGTGVVTATGSANTSVAPAAKAAATKAPAKSGGTTAKYVSSGRTSNLYGYPDLQVRMLSNFTSIRSGAQVPLQFVVENVGTNVVPANWTFTASLPYTPVYTYTSPAQQALYPGDKVVYTLTYTAQLPANQFTGGGNPCNGWYPCDPGTPVYGGPGTCNSYGPCNVSGYSSNVYGYTQPGYTNNTQSASVQIDPFNLVWELNEGDNTAGISYQVY